MIFIAYLVLILSFLNLLRIAIFLIGSDLYDVKHRNDVKQHHKFKNGYRPLVTVIVPAHNEELVLWRNLESIAANTYRKIELIVVNDSSDDKTGEIARKFQRKYRHRFTRIKVMTVRVRGKASAMNAGLKHAKGQLFMCLDADSMLDKDAIRSAVIEFQDKTIGTIAANVKIMPGKGIINTFQQIEYLIGQQGKKMENLAGIQYIVGGVGSMFRTHLVRKAGLYDTNTITEDIDLSMKLIDQFGDKYRVSYTPSVITYTESVQDLFGLMRQRFRWKYGRYQVFLKYKKLFFSREKHHSKALTWVYLPYALFSELLYSLEPLVFILIISLLVQYGDITIIAASFLIFTFYTTMQITAATGKYRVRDRIKLLSIGPLAYVGMFLLSFVEYTATLRGFIAIPKIYREHKAGRATSEWQHVKRSGHAVSI